jgi:hypothetical protein
MEQENNFLLSYFTKFKGYDNYDVLYEELDKLSKYQYKGDIDLGSYVIPDVSPDDKLFTFPNKVKKIWGDEAYQELKYAIKFYEGEHISNDIEALIIIEIKYRETKDDIFLQIKDILFNNEKLTDEIIEKILISHKDIITNSLIFYFISK